MGEDEEEKLILISIIFKKWDSVIHINHTVLFSYNRNLQRQKFWCCFGREKVQGFCLWRYSLALHPAILLK